MKRLLLLAVLLSAGVGFGQTKSQPKSVTWLRHETHDEIHGDLLSFILPSTETPIRSLTDRAAMPRTYIDLICGGDGSVEVASIAFPMPLHIDNTNVDEYGTEFSTEIRYRQGNEVVSRLAVIEDDGTSVFTRNAEWFKPFVGKAIEIEDAYGHVHVFHFPSVTLEPFEGGCKKMDYVQEVEREGTDAICSVIKQRYGDNVRELAVGADDEAGTSTHKHASQFDADLKKDIAKYPQSDLSSIKPILQR